MIDIKWKPISNKNEDNEPGPFIFNSTSDVKTPSLQYVNYNNNNDLNLQNINENLDNNNT
jgi:hypothetical protein